MRGMSYEPPRFKVNIDYDACIRCGRCATECGWDVIAFDGKPKEAIPRPDHAKCRSCQRCAAYCPVNCISIERAPEAYAPDAGWTAERRSNVRLQSDTGGILLTSMGSNKLPYEIFDRLLLDACQVTNPSIDPLREPMELATFIGARGKSVKIEGTYKEGYRLLKKKQRYNTPLLKLDSPIILAPMSYGSISLNAHRALAAAAKSRGLLMGTGEGGLHADLYPYGDHIITQFASGRFAVDVEALQRGAGVEIKVGQGAKPGIGGHLPGEKIDAEISATRMIPQGTDAISPAPHHDIYSIEDLRQLISALKETSDGKPVGVKIAAVHNVAAIAAGVVHAGADWVTLDGFSGATGAAPAVIRDNVGLPLALAIAVVDQRLREEGLRHRASILASGSIRSAGDMVKAIALGADAVVIGTAPLIALGCRVCRGCHTGRCSWGIATQRPELTKRLDPVECAARVENLIDAWTHELTDILGAMGVNALESLRGDRDRLRAFDLDAQTCEILGVSPAGR